MNIIPEPREARSKSDFNRRIDGECHFTFNLKVKTKTFKSKLSPVPCECGGQTPPYITHPPFKHLHSFLMTCACSTQNRSGRWPLKWMSNSRTYQGLTRAFRLTLAGTLVSERRPNDVRNRKLYKYCK